MAHKTFKVTIKKTWRGVPAKRRNSQTDHRTGKAEFDSPRSKARVPLYKDRRNERHEGGSRR